MQGSPQTGPCSGRSGASFSHAPGAQGPQVGCFSLHMPPSCSAPIMKATPEEPGTGPGSCGRQLRSLGARGDKSSPGMEPRLLVARRADCGPLGLWASPPHLSHPSTPGLARALLSLSLKASVRHGFSVLSDRTPVPGALWPPRPLSPAQCPDLPACLRVLRLGRRLLPRWPLWWCCPDRCGGQWSRTGGVAWESSAGLWGDMGRAQVTGRPPLCCVGKQGPGRGLCPPFLGCVAWWPPVFLCLPGGLVLSPERATASGHWCFCRLWGRGGLGPLSGAHSQGHVAG